MAGVVFLKKWLPAAVLAVTACSNIDCPLDNVVALNCGLYSAEEKTSLTLRDTLTVYGRGFGRDTVLLNRALGISSFLLPVRQGFREDTLLLRLSNLEGQEATDTIFLKHTNEPHFESLDCPPAVFHTLQGVRWTSHALSLMPLTVDSVAVVRTTVNYDDIENLKIYLRATSK